MFPGDSGALQIVFGALRSGESPKKSDFFKIFCRPTIFVGPKIICRESFEMDFGGVSVGVELILGCKQSFEAWRMYVFERSESSEASRAKRSESFCDVK